jgi:hypothetical protein
MKFEWLLDHELRLAVRHRCYVSVIMMMPRSKKDVSVERLLKQTLRESDCHLVVEGQDVILMPRTTKREAYRAVKRFKELCNGEVDVRYSIVTYPGDGGTVHSMISTAKRRLIGAGRAGFGAIISSG